MCRTIFVVQLPQQSSHAFVQIKLLHDVKQQFVLWLQSKLRESLHSYYSQFVLLRNHASPIH
jgi:hypothetical protein